MALSTQVTVSSSLYADQRLRAADPPPTVGAVQRSESGSFVSVVTCLLITNGRQQHLRLCLLSDPLHESRSPDLQRTPKLKGTDVESAIAAAANVTE